MTLFKFVVLLIWKRPNRNIQWNERIANKHRICIFKEFFFLFIYFDGNFVFVTAWPSTSMQQYEFVRIEESQTEYLQRIISHYFKHTWNKSNLFGLLISLKYKIRRKSHFFLPIFRVTAASHCHDLNEIALRNPLRWNVSFSLCVPSRIFVHDS